MTSLLIAHDLAVLTCAWFVHYLHITCSWLVPTSVHDLLFDHIIFTTCSWIIHSFFMTCSFLVHNLFTIRPNVQHLFSNTSVFSLQIMVKYSKCSKGFPISNEITPASFRFLRKSREKHLHKGRVKKKVENKEEGGVSVDQISIFIPFFWKTQKIETPEIAQKSLKNKLFFLQILTRSVLIWEAQSSKLSWRAIYQRTRIIENSFIVFRFLSFKIFKRRQVASIRPNVFWSVGLSVCGIFFFKSKESNNQKNQIWIFDFSVKG